MVKQTNETENRRGRKPVPLNEKLVKKLVIKFPFDKEDEDTAYKGNFKDYAAWIGSKAGQGNKLKAAKLVYTWGAKACTTGKIEEEDEEDIEEEDEEDIEESGTRRFDAKKKPNGASKTKTPFGLGPNLKYDLLSFMIQNPDAANDIIEVANTYATKMR